jgi:hypothetical protein
MRAKGFEVVGASGFEPPTSWSRTRRASQAALRPDRAYIVQQSALDRSGNEASAVIFRS